MTHAGPGGRQPADAEGPYVLVRAWVLPYLVGAARSASPAQTTVEAMFMLYTQLLRLSTASKGRDVYAAQATIGTALGWSSDKVTRTLNALRAVGLVSWRRRGRGMTNLYTVTTVEPGSLRTDAESKPGA